MRRVVPLLLAAGLAVAALPSVAVAQSQGGRGETADGQQANQRERQPRFAPLSRRANAGPCPTVRILYDAARYVELADGRARAGSVGWTGEIEGVTSECSYRNDEPITIDMDLLFRLGKGPAAQGEGRTYRYWVAVTARDRAVLAKEYFDLPVNFVDGVDRMEARELQQIVIPRATATTSGENFEVLIGFDVTPEMAQFNRTGSRFCVDASGTDPGTCVRR
ncbi:MAG: Tat pathway signal sequence domain protein [Caulobacteraceae bacterium]|nr:Tat pathway signal sequence domain protein [Caulobacteraceae bacterium]